VIEVTLTAADVSWARDVGRQRIALAPGNPRFAYKERSGLDTHTIGAMAELAAAKAIGVPWPARVNTFRELPDLDPFWEVRWSSNPRKVKVAVDDKPELLVCHVTGQGPEFKVHGFTKVSWVQQNTQPVDPGDRGWSAHFVDAYMLSPIDPGFHSVCAWFNGGGEWLCLFCGKEFEDAHQREGHQLAPASGAA
jgi:hypothetical protein